MMVSKVIFIFISGFLDVSFLFVEYITFYYNYRLGGKRNFEGWNFIFIVLILGWFFSFIFRRYVSFRWASSFW